MLVLREKGLNGKVESVAFAPDGASVLTCGADGVALWPGVPGAPARRQLGGFARLARISPCGRYVATTEQGVTVHDLRAGTRTPVALWAQGWPATFAFAPNSDLVVCQLLSNAETGRAARRAAGNWDEARWERDLPQFVSCDLAFAGADRFAFAWLVQREETYGYYVTCSAETGAEMSAVRGPELFCPVLAFEPNRRLLAGTIDNRIVVVSADDCSAPLARVKSDTPKHFTGTAFHPSGKYLAATSNDETVKLYDTATWQVAHTFTWKIGRMRSVAFSPDGALAAAGSDKGQVVVWDVDL